MDGKLVLADAVGPRADGVGAPANVPVPAVGTEEPVIGKQRWEEIRRMRADGQAVSQIARATGLDRKTVRGCLRQCEWQPYRRTPLVETLLAAHVGWLTERAPQVNFSAQILFQELRASRGYEGGYDTVRKTRCGRCVPRPRWRRSRNGDLPRDPRTVGYLATAPSLMNA